MKLLTSCLAISALFLGPQSTAQDCSGEDCAAERAALKKAQKKKQAADALLPKFTAPKRISVEQDYEPNPAIWKLADEDTTIYMFGTFHILPAGFEWRSDAFNTIVEEVDELVVETSDDDGNAQIEAFMMDLVAKAMSEERVTISERLSEDNRTKWFAIADQTEMPREFFDRMPLMISMLGAGLSLGMEQGSTEEFGVETVLEAEFKAAGKPIGSIEDSDSVMAALLGIDEDGLIKELDEELSKWDGKNVSVFFEDMDGVSGNADEAAEDTASDDNQPAAPDPFASEHNWAQGILDNLGMEEMKSTEFGKQIYQVLLTDRNRAWAGWLQTRLDTPGTILLAVGAGHFEGDDSVQAMLIERGLTAERIH